MIDELNVIECIQKYNIKNLMVLISEPFNTFTFVVLLIIFYKYEFINIFDIIFLLIVSILLLFIKLCTKRNRPYHQSNRIRNLSFKTHSSVFDKYSFLSGHTFSATLIALILLKNYPNEYLLYLLPILVGISRVYLGVHFSSDIIAASILAIIYFKLFYSSEVIIKN